MALSERDVAVLETAEELHGHLDNGAALIRTRTGLSPSRFVQILHHLVLDDERVVSDPRWTMLAHRIQDEAAIRSRMRAARTFDRGVPMRRAS